MFFDKKATFKTELVTRCNKITDLDLSKCTYVRKTALSSIIKHLKPTLEKLTVFGCCGIACPHEDWQWCPTSYPSGGGNLTSFYELKSMMNLKCLVINEFNQFEDAMGKLKIELPDVEISHDFSDGIAKFKMN